jgi:sporulation protein YlmC with PRC-barrel domain
MRHGLVTLLTCGLAFGTAGLAMSQDVEVKVPARSSDEGSGSVYNASEVIGMTIKNDKNEEVGTIKDLVIDAKTGEVLYAVMDLGEYVDVQNKVFVMPWTVLRPNFGPNPYVTLGVPRTVLTQAPNWTLTDFRRARYATWAPQVNRYYSSHVRTGIRQGGRAAGFRGNDPNITIERTAPAPVGQKPRVKPVKPAPPDADNPDDNASNPDEDKPSTKPRKSATTDKNADDDSANEDSDAAEDADNEKPEAKPSPKKAPAPPKPDEGSDNDEGASSEDKPEPKPESKPEPKPGKGKKPE